jgi:hypothetical protein
MLVWKKLHLFSVTSRGRPLAPRGGSSKPCRVMVCRTVRVEQSVVVAIPCNLLMCMLTVVSGTATLRRVTLSSDAEHNRKVILVIKGLNCNVL